VIADPDDDGIRAVYADVLGERGEPQGELIATQLALATAGIYDANDLVAHACRGDELARLAGLLRHSDKLIASHHDDWLVAVVGEPHNGSTTIRRGFFEMMEFSVDNTSPGAIAHAVANTPLRELYLDGRDRDDQALDNAYVEMLADLPLHHLSVLDFCGYDVSAAALAAWFGQLPLLTSVGFAKPQHDEFDVRQLSPLDGLRHLDLGYVPLQPSDLDRLGRLPCAATLEHLSISTRAPLSNLEAVFDGRFPRLRSLALSGTVDFTRLATFPTVTMPARLNLRHCRLSPASLEALVAHPAAGLLETLDLESVDLLDAGAFAIARSRQLTNLSTLNLDATGIRDDAARALGQCASARLTDLDIANNQLTASGFADLVGGHALQRLRYFARTPLVDGTAVASIVGRCATLRRLVIGPLGTNGIQILIDSSALEYLRELWVSDADPSLARLQFPDLVTFRACSGMPSAVRTAIIERALPALVMAD
jgi:uncharacterized protein (TIGR02996 family)